MRRVGRHPLHPRERERADGVPARGHARGRQVLYLVRLHATAGRLVTADIRVGSSLPAVASSLGKMLLAEHTPGELDAVVRARSFGHAVGPNAVASRQALEDQLAAVRASGYSIQDEEVARGIRSVAGPVRGPDGRCIAATNLAVSAGKYAVDELVARVAGPLLETCGAISDRISEGGGRGTGR